MNARILKFLKLSLPGLLLVPLLAISACSNSALTFSPETLPGATLYQPYQATISISGYKTPVGFIGIDSGSLPDGLRLVYEQGKNTATISGDPTLLGTFSFTMNTWCMGTNRQSQSGQHQYQITVTRD
jgi:hypothetical protein